MQAAFKLLQKQLPNIGGMEDTLKCIVFVKKRGGKYHCEIYDTGLSNLIVSVINPVL